MHAKRLIIRIEGRKQVAGVAHGSFCTMHNSVRPGMIEVNGHWNLIWLKIFFEMTMCKGSFLLGASLAESDFGLCLNLLWLWIFVMALRARKRGTRQRMAHRH